MSRTITVPAHFYRQFPVDYTATHPAIGFKGWCTRILSMPLEKSALVPMHLWNVGLVNELPWEPDSPYPGWMRMAEWAPRCGKIIRETIPPVFDAVRRVGLPILHIASSASYAEHYPGYAKVKALARPEPEPPAGAVQSDWGEEHTRERFGEGHIEDVHAGSPYLDFPPNLRPLHEEPVVVTTHQFNAVLRERGIWNLIYVGFAINWCLWFSPCGMSDMRRLGYRCSTIRQCVTTVERKESAPQMLNLEEAMWRTSLMFGYIFDDQPFIQALREVTG